MAEFLNHPINRPRQVAGIVLELVPEMSFPLATHVARVCIAMTND
jgi:hypothetical protein